jgi:hypothetical protein
MTMIATQSFISDGSSRLQKCEEFRAKCNELWLTIKLKYAEEIAAANSFRRIQLKLAMRREYRVGVCEIAPSERTQWLSALK